MENEMVSQWGPRCSKWTSQTAFTFVCLNFENLILFGHNFTIGSEIEIVSYAWRTATDVRLLRFSELKHKIKREQIKHQFIFIWFLAKRFFFLVNAAQRLPPPFRRQQKLH